MVPVVPPSKTVANPVGVEVVPVVEAAPVAGAPKEACGIELLKPEQTARKLKPGPLPGEYVLYTGDYCRLDEEGYLYFVGRMDDIIKSRGEKVAPKEIEHVLYNIKGVRDAAVIGVPDQTLGQAVKAFVVLEQGSRLTPKDIQRECQAKLESFMLPKYVEIVQDLPTTSTGKIKKTDLR